MPKKKLEDTAPIKVTQPKDETRPVKVKRIPSDKKPSTEVESAAPRNEIPAVEILPQKKSGRRKWIWLSVLIMLLITAVGLAVGYMFAMQARHQAELVQRLTAANEQFARAILDQEAGNYTLAKQRFEYVLNLYPEYPGIEQKLVEVGIAIAQSQNNTQVATPMPLEITPTLAIIVPTKDTKSPPILLQQAQAQYAAGDWPGLYATVSSMRDIDPTYEPTKVDGLYYAALRNHGIAEIQAGNLEMGLYDFALAEDMAPIDTDAQSYRAWARMYLNAGSWWSVNWANAVDQFSTLYGMVPRLMDSSGITVTERYARALEGYGDMLQQSYDWCGAVSSYEKALSIYSYQKLADRMPQAREYCNNPPPTPTPTVDPNAPTPTPTPD